MEFWWQGVVEDFSDLPDIGQVIRIAVRLVLAAFLGGVLGFEREQSGKSAGLRTHMLVALGAALFVLIPQQAEMALADMSRVIQGVVAGIGFIGAGAILKHAEQQEVKGLTTAAGLWLTAAVGMAAGLGREASAILGAVLAFFILYALQRASQWLNEGADHKNTDQAKVGGDGHRPTQSDKT